MSDDYVKNFWLGLWFLASLYAVGKEAYALTSGNWWAVFVICTVWVVGLALFSD
jgi:hypothetical protein